MVKIKLKGVGAIFSPTVGIIFTIIKIGFCNAFGADLCGNASLPLTSNTAVFFSPNKVNSEVAGCQSSYFTDAKGLYRENHAIHFLEQNNQPSKVYLNLFVKDNLVPSFVTIVLDSFSSQWIIQLGKTLPSSTTLKFMASEGSTIKTVGDGFEVNPIIFKSKQSRLTQDVFDYHKAFLFDTNNNKVTTFTEISNGRIANVSLRIGEADPPSSVASKCALKNGVLPHQITANIFDDNAASDGCESSTLSYNSEMLIIDIENESYDTIDVRVVYELSLSSANVIVLRSKRAVMWNVDLSLPNSLSAKDVHFVINSDNSSLVANSDIISEKMNLLTHDFKTLLAEKYQTKGFRYMKYDRPTRFILITPDGPLSDPFGAFMEATEMEYTHSDFITFMHNANCICPISENRFHISIMDLLTMSSTIKPEDIIVKGCPVTMVHTDDLWVLDIPQDLFGICGVEKTPTNKLRLTVSLKSGREYLDVPIECEPDAQGGDTGNFIYQPPLQALESCEIFSVVDDSDIDSIKLMIPLDGIQRCSTTTDEIVAALNGCAPISNSTEHFLEVSITAGNAQNCRLFHDRKGYFLEMNNGLGENVILTADSPDIAQTFPENEFKLEVLSSFSDSEHSVVSFPASFSTDKPQILYLKIFNNKKGHFVHIDSCSVVKPGLLATKNEVETLIRNNCPVNDLVRFLSPYYDEDYVQYAVFDVAKLLLKHGSFQITCKLKPCFMENASSEIICMYPHGQYCDHDSSKFNPLLLHMGDPSSVQPLSTGLFRKTLKAVHLQNTKIQAKPSKPPANSQPLLTDTIRLLVLAVLAAFLIGMLMIVAIWCIHGHKSGTKLICFNKSQKKLNKTNDNTCIKMQVPAVYAGESVCSSSIVERQSLLDKNSDDGKRNSSTTSGISVQGSAGTSNSSSTHNQPLHSITNEDTKLLNEDNDKNASNISHDCKPQTTTQTQYNNGDLPHNVETRGKVVDLTKNETYSNNLSPKGTSRDSETLSTNTGASFYPVPATFCTLHEEVL